jgi:branched-subunit amino acid transport protein
MNLQGLIIGIVTFLIIGCFHPIVIKCEYYFGKKIWPAFLIAGILGILLSLWTRSLLLSCITGVFGFSSLWAIHEIIEQEERVKKGWFPKNPDKKTK